MGGLQAIRNVVFPFPTVSRNTLFWAQRFGYAYLALSFIDTCLFRLQWVEGVSMSPTLSPHYNERGKRDVILTYNHALFGSEIKRGDVIRFTKPHDPDGEGVKRVVALPGDTVLRDVRRVGKQAREEGKESRKLGLSELPPVVVVPEGHVWVEGDNWRKTLDSNDYGPISLNLINGRARAIVWPPSRMGKIDENPAGKEKSRTHVIKRDSGTKIDWELV